MGLNLVTVKLFGEMEFWFALIKIIAIVVLIAVGLWMIFTGFTSTAGEVASLLTCGHMMVYSPQG